MDPMDPIERECARARLSNLVLNFDSDLWNAILLWPVDPDLAAHNYDCFSNLVKPTGSFSREDVLAVTVRVSKLVRVCKTFYNRYREMNRHHWQQSLLLRVAYTSKMDRTPLEWTLLEPAKGLKGAPQYRYNGPCDALPVTVANVRVKNRQTNMVKARAYNSSDDERVRHRMYLRQEMEFEYDILVTESLLTWTDVTHLDSSYAVLTWTNETTGPANPANPVAMGAAVVVPPDRSVKAMYLPFKAADVCLIGITATVLDNGRAGYACDREVVSTLPDGPEQYRTMFWMPCSTTVEMRLKVPGGTVKLTGLLNLSSCGLTSSKRLSAWRSVLDKGESVPAETEAGVINWDHVEYSADAVRPQLPNMRVFLPPPSSRARGVKRAAPTAQGRGNLDSSDDED